MERQREALLCTMLSSTFITKNLKSYLCDRRNLLHIMCKIEMLLFDQFLTPIFKSKFTAQPIHLIMIVVCFTRQELTCEWRHCKRGSSACESNHFLRLSRWVFSGSALPHQTSLRNLTLVVGRHYTSHNIFL